MDGWCQMRGAASAHVDLQLSGRRTLPPRTQSAISAENPRAFFSIMAKSNKNTRPEARLPKGFQDTPRGRPARDQPHAGHHPRGVRALRLRAAGDAGHRVHRRARQVPARPGPAQRGRVLVPGRGRAVDEPALRPHRAARPLRRREAQGAEAARCPSAATPSAPCGATRSRAPAASASSPSSTPTRWAPTTSPRMPRSACWRRTRWRRWASSAAST